MGKPDVGCYVHGLFMEGARWDDDAGHMEESFPKVLFSGLPYMHWSPVERHKDPTDMNRVYLSPLYKTSERKGVLATTGHSSNRVMSLLIAIAERHSEKYWTKRGVACLTQLDNRWAQIVVRNASHLTMPRWSSKQQLTASTKRERILSGGCLICLGNLWLQLG